MSRLPISLLPRAVANATGKPAPKGRKVYELVVQGVIPAVYETGRWYYDPATMPEIVAAMGYALNSASRQAA